LRQEFGYPTDVEYRARDLVGRMACLLWDAKVYSSR